MVLFYLTDHAEFLHELPDAEMIDLLPTAKKVAQAIGCKEYNILQNNGRLAHQVTKKCKKRGGERRQGFQLVLTKMDFVISGI